MARAAEALSQSLQYAARQDRQTRNLNTALQWIAPVIALDIPTRQLVGATAASAIRTTPTRAISGNPLCNLG